MSAYQAGSVGKINVPWMVVGIAVVLSVVFGVGFFTAGRSAFLDYLSFVLPCLAALIGGIGILFADGSAAGTSSPGSASNTREQVSALAFASSIGLLATAFFCYVITKGNPLINEIAKYLTYGVLILICVIAVSVYFYLSYVSDALKINTYALFKWLLFLLPVFALALAVLVK